VGRQGIALLLGLLLCAAGACSPTQDEAPGAPAPAAPLVETAPAPEYLGLAACADCHAEEAERWRGSHHDLAMQEASDESVLGDFADAAITHFGVTSSFFRQDGGFFVRTEGPDGQHGDFEIAYTFGFDPLQQYLVRFPGGRLQALSLAWDARPAEAGGQRWFHLYPDEAIAHDDILHWTAAAQNWNFMCADCHSTGLQKGYDLAEDRYETTWQELNVSCEACHGPGSAHVAWAEARAAGAEEGASAEGGSLGLAVDLRNHGQWIFDPGAAIARRQGPEPSGTELDTCAPCHARRAAIGRGREPGAPFLDSHLPTLLEAGLYHADGQILDEVYVWGSFLQSRMHAKGVACSDCHDPHSLALEGEPSDVCARCHRPEVFATPEHHGHAPGGEGSRCVDCHMPARTYMVVDPRRDHSFRVPRPDLSLKLGVPNACTGCHSERSDTWAEEAIAAWRGAERSSPMQYPIHYPTHYGELLAAGQRRLPGAEAALAKLVQNGEQPPMVRASALQLLRDRPGSATLDAVAAGAGDADPLVRLAAVEASQALDPGTRVRLIAPLLRDPLRAVRIQAASSLAPVPPQLWPRGERARLADGLAEYREAQHANADRPEAHLNLGALHAQFGEHAEARREYETALRLGPHFLPTYVNLADLDRQLDRDEAGEQVLRRGLAIEPESADLQHALGLLLVREQRHDEAVSALGRAAELAPDRARYAYVYGIALHSTGQAERGLAVLAEAQRRHPTDWEILLALASFHRDAGAVSKARDYAARLLALDPENPQAQALARELAGEGAPQ